MAQSNKYDLKALPLRFREKIQVNPDTDCWDWTGWHDHYGYGAYHVRMGTGGVRQVYGKSHRAVYELLVSPIPTGLTIDHLCRNRACVNPEHMEITTLTVNVLRGISPPARNRRKTHCPQGHEYSPANTYVSPRGWRQCRSCKRELYDPQNRERRRDRLRYLKRQASQQQSS